jgi:hypothetical protein
MRLEVVRRRAPEEYGSFQVWLTFGKQVYCLA